MNKEQLEAESKTLLPCPFCGGKAKFDWDEKTAIKLYIYHCPESGVVCPATYEQWCESFDIGRDWWNKRKV